ncbi:MAG: MFS transporter [Bacteroidia bacterium]|nr:MFS transporter [Bacteroidia bacterium]
MSFGFLGIQFGFALQNSNVSRIFQTLGANQDEIPILWIAAPVTGLLVQPIVGHISDSTWHKRWGRRRPFFFLGALLAAFALIFMPNSNALWIAGALLWLMDASINISMEPFRAFVGDMLPSRQRTLGFATQSFFIGIGAVVASMLPWMFTNWFLVSNTAAEGIIPDSVKYSFYIGAIVFLMAVLYTVFTTKEYEPGTHGMPPLDEYKPSIAQSLADSFKGVMQMPKTMKQLAVVQFFTWYALFCMWIYTTTAVTSSIYKTSDTTSAAYNEGADWVGICFAAYSGVAALVAFFLPPLAKLFSRRITYIICLISGAAGLVSIAYIQNPDLLLLSMIGVGVAWAGILSMPYAILAGSLPAGKMGYFMGVFNFFIVIPQIVASFSLGPILKYVFNNEAQYMLLLGGLSMIIAAVICTRVQDSDDKKLGV